MASVVGGGLKAGMATFPTGTLAALLSDCDCGRGYAASADLGSIRKDWLWLSEELVYDEVELDEWLIGAKP